VKNTKEGEQMQTFRLELKAPIDGIYLNSETIDLLGIIQCKDREELEEFARNCSQLNLSEQEIDAWGEKKLEELKRQFVEQYKNTLVPIEQSVQDRKNLLKATLEHVGISTEEIGAYITTFQNEGPEGVKQKLLAEYPEQYALLTEKAHQFIAEERDQMRSVTYEELSAINEILPSHNTILIGSGRYYNVTKAMYSEQVPGMTKYDFYHAQRELDFCEKNGMHARYHTLLDRHTALEGRFTGKSKQEVLSELQQYVAQSIKFINEYNAKHKIDGKGVISSVDLFNEIISFDPPYQNIWEEQYGIKLDELLGVFQCALADKPEGVTYVYNEPFLEDKDRRETVLALLGQIQRLAPGLIDTIGTQMHIEIDKREETIQNIGECFADLKKLQEIGIGTQITEFDMCLPERFMFDEQGNINQTYTPEYILDYKAKRMAQIARTIAETGIELEGITYWSISDTLDHNLERTNRKTYQQNLRRSIATTRYAGLYSGLERRKAVSTQRLGQESIEEQKDVVLLDEIAEVKANQRSIDANQRESI